MTTHQDFTVKSNARRAAKKAGLDPASVQTIIKAGAKIYRLPLAPEPRPEPAPAPQKAAKAPKQTAMALKGGKAKKPKNTLPRKNADKGGNRAVILSLITRAGGAFMAKEIIPATGLLPHTLRARISEIAKAEGLSIDRKRILGDSQYTATKAA